MFLKHYFCQCIWCVARAKTLVQTGLHIYSVSLRAIYNTPFTTDRDTECFGTIE